MENQNKITCDIAVVGSGVAGLTAAVQAARLGKKVVLLESGKRTGGNWDVTYGMMAVESPLSKKQGIHVDVRALVNQEVRLFNYQVDAKMWMDLADASGENVSWLMDQGVVFNPDLEPYTAGDINAPVFHRWAKGVSPSRKMAETLKSTGGEILTETKAADLIMKEGKVTGLTAKRKDGSVLTIACKAVISAGGGYVKNPDMVARTIGRKDYAARGIAENDGSSIMMCIRAGAKSLLSHGNQIVDLIPAQMKMVSHWLTYIHSRPGSFPFHVSVNQDGDRYTDEAATLKLYAFAPAAAYTQEKTFSIYDEEKLRKLQEINQNDLFVKFKHAADQNEEGIFRADTFEELGEKLGLNPERFAETMNCYNAFCRAGKDTEFEKTPEFLQEFKAPFYGWENSYQIASTLEGIDYNRKMEVLSEEKQPIPGLYVAGTDGAKLWRDYYSLAIPGSCNANNVYSGRTAAKNAVEYITKNSL